MNPSDGVINPTELCFDKNEFMKATFSVDDFLHKNRNAASLELLRDNLGIYLKVLRSSMIDLINEDYADFVSLSANLVGLDQCIETISQPLELFRADIASIKDLINSNENEIRDCLRQKSELRVFKRNLQCLKKVYGSMKKLEELLDTKLNKEDFQPTDLERSSLELVQLKFNLKFCEEFVSNEQKEKVSTLSEGFMRKLRAFFKQSLQTSAVSTENLERCLRIYITLDACTVAEDVFREEVVGPYMADTISEQALQNSPHGLAGIYNKILNFISLHMADLLRVTQYSDKLKGFDFLVNSFWKDVEMRLETHMSSIFAPGNSEVFFTKYKCTREFLNQVEEMLVHENAVLAFRQNPQTRSFQARWNLPVYFQICFQEIASSLETVLEPVLNAEKFSSTKSEFSLLPFAVALKSINRCWSEGTYLAEVFPKFFKLTIQITFRLSQWVCSALQLLANGEPPIPTSKSNAFIKFYTDIQMFVQKLPEIQELILKSIPGNYNENSQLLTISVDNIKSVYEQHLTTIEKQLTQLIIKESMESIKQVQDIPRLYRKTNREIPTRNSIYLDHMLKPIRSFKEEFGGKLSKDILQRIMLNVFSTVTVQYHKTVLEVLTSVQKTEESLRRLRNLKDKSNANQSATPTISDDDKIRLQLRVDVIGWTNEACKFEFTPSDIDHLLELNSYVEEVVKISDSN